MNHRLCYRPIKVFNRWPGYWLYATCDLRLTMGVRASAPETREEDPAKEIETREEDPAKARAKELEDEWPLFMLSG